MVLYTRPPIVEVYQGDPFASPCECLVIPVFQGADGKPMVGVVGDLDRGGQLKGASDLGFFKAGVGEVLRAYVDGKLAVYVGLGRFDDEWSKLLENTRRGLASGVKQVVESAKCSLLVLSRLNQDVAREALLAALLASYRLEAFTSERKRLIERILVDRGDLDLDYVMAVAEGVYLARDIANAPPHELPPRRLAEVVKELFSKYPNVAVEVFDFDRLVEGGFGGIVSVGKGSKEKPVMVVLQYKGSSGAPVALVGKTVVFDTGGINIKTGESLVYMRSDKAGGAAVLGALWTISKLNLKVNVAGLVPAVINVPGGESYLPSDIIKMWDGTVVEVTNTDAEGRLIIGDAIAYAAKALGAAEVIDLATLTGAIVVALGPLIAGLFTRDERLREGLLEASKRTGEKLWPMPVEDDYKQWLTRGAMVGDIANAGQRAGGAIYGALFLERFSHGKPFAHLDIAGPGMGYEASGVAPAYWPDRNLAPGYGVRLIVEYILSRSIAVASS
jgi:leucyl aminopeptidase